MVSSPAVSESKKIVVAIVDDDAIVRAALIELLRGVENIEVVAEASTGEEMVHSVRDIRPDVILLDITMPGIGGLETAHQLKRFAPATKIIILTAHANAPYPDQFLNGVKVKIDGYLLKDCDAKELNTAIRTVLQGDCYVTIRIAQDLALKKTGVHEASPFGTLSDLELEVLYMMIQRKSVAAIAKDLCISAETVKSHRYLIFEKLKVNTDVEVVKLAAKHGLLNSL